MGNVISQVSQQEVSEPEAVKKILEQSLKDKMESVLLQVYEDGFSKFLILKLK